MRWIRGLLKTRRMRLTRLNLMLSGCRRGAPGIMSTLDELIDQEMQEAKQ